MLRKNNRIFRGALIAVLAAMCLSSTGTIFARTWSENGVLNNFEMGVVDISVDEYQRVSAKDPAGKNPGIVKETEYDRNKQVVPGQVVSKIPRVTCEGADCYIRFAVSYDRTSDAYRGLSDDEITGLNKSLIYKDGYYYYKNILKHGDSVDLFTGVNIPKDQISTVDKSGNKGSFDLTVHVDAIQAKNFTPNFSGKAPWGQVSIQKFESSEGYTFSELTVKRSSVTLSVDIEDSAEGIVIQPSDFFANFPYMMPGDHLEDEIRLENSTKDNQELFFGTFITDKNNKSLSRMTVKIDLTKGGKTRTVYEGILNKALAYTSLGFFAPGEKAVMHFEIDVPKELDNAYALDKGSVRWMWAAGKDGKPVTTPVLPWLGYVKTYDDGIGLYVVTAVISGTLLVLLLRPRRSGHKKKEKEDSDEEETEEM